MRHGTCWWQVTVLAFGVPWLEAAAAALARHSPVTAAASGLLGVELPTGDAFVAAAYTATLRTRNKLATTNTRTFIVYLPL